MALNLDPWWDEPACKAAQGTFSDRETFILAKPQDHDAAKLHEVLSDLYRDAVREPQARRGSRYRRILLVDMLSHYAREDVNSITRRHVAAKAREVVAALEVAPPPLPTAPAPPEGLRLITGGRA